MRTFRFLCRASNDKQTFEVIVYGNGENVRKARDNAIETVENHGLTVVSIRPYTHDIERHIINKC